MNGPQSYTIGETGTLWDPTDGVTLATIKVSAPQFATTDASGNTPQNGFFAIFTVTVTNVAPASSADTITPSSGDFYVLAGGTQFASQPDDGNDLGINDLGGPALGPGQSTTGTVTVDEPSQSGSLVYAPGGGATALGAWSF